MRTSASVAGYSRRSSASIASYALSWLAVRLVTCAAYCRRSHCPDVTRMRFRDWPTRSVPFRPAGRPRCVGRRVPAACLQEVASGVFQANRRVGEASFCATAPGGRPNVHQYFRKPPPRVRTPDRRSGRQLLPVRSHVELERRISHTLSPSRVPLTHAYPVNAHTHYM